MSSYSNGKYLIRAFATDSAPGAYSNWSLTWEITINIADDVVDGSKGGDGKNNSAPRPSNIITFLTSTTGMTIIGIAGAMLVAVIVIIKKRGFYKPSGKDRRRIDEYREVFK